MTVREPERIPSTDGVAVALHELAGPPDAAPLLFSHATGFHAHCYRPMAELLGGDFRCYGHDHRGHGHTTAPAEWQVDWYGFGDDAVAVASARVERHGRPLVAFGHSMGGATLLMAAARRPELFERLVLFEPIAPAEQRDPIDMESLPIVRGARRRRRRFDSFDDAYRNYRDKPPMSLMTPDVLRDYVDFGFRPVGAGGEVELRCAPEFEAAVFVNARRNGVWELLPDVATPTTVIAGVIDAEQPSRWCEAAAERLPRGRYVHLPHQSHFGPFSHPDELAELVRSVA